MIFINFGKGLEGFREGMLGNEITYQAELKYQKYYPTLKYKIAFTSFKIK